jgi:hypothetical protein
MPPRASRLERSVLLAPDAVARATARTRRDPREKWMLRQSRAVRVSFVREVLDAGADPTREEIWMLRQTNAVRESYVREVLEPGDG